jgi:membrane protein DedA with SNARE-associated domain/membrane-associated phospholipid phosphatase
MNLAHYHWVHVVSQHPHWAGWIIFFFAFSEALAVIGTFIPGTTAMFLAGTLVGAGYLNVWSAFAYAILGAILGDGSSYWIGHHYQRQLVHIWPFRTHPGLIERGEAFIREHGGKSIVLGRFVGPVRAIVPVAAGMLEMPPARFYIINVLSALAWAPVHIIPGIIFGKSLQLAGAVTARMIAVLILLGFILWLAIWLVRTVLTYGLPWIDRQRARLLGWAARHPNRVTRLLTAILDPDRASPAALLLFAILLIAGGGIFIAVLEDVVTGAPLVQIDDSVFQFLQGLRNPRMDRIMVIITTLGSAAATLPLIIAVTAWLAWRRDWRTIGYWVAAYGFGELLVEVLKLVLHRPRPMNVSIGLQFYSFPSGHATMSAVTYGFLAVLIGRELRPNGRLAAAIIAAVLITSISFSRLYLGAHWLSDVVAGISLGLLWVALLAIAYNTHHPPALPARQFTAIAAVAISLGAGWHLYRHLPAEMARYEPEHHEVLVAQAQWLARGWQQLPANRESLSGQPREPLTIQWAAEPATIRTALAAQGWRPAVQGVSQLLLWLAPNEPATALPTLPRLNHGDAPAITLIHPGDQPGRRLVLRLWPTTHLVRYGVDGQDVPLLAGTINREEMHRYLSLITVVTAHRWVDPRPWLASLPGARVVFRRDAQGRTVPLVLVSTTATAVVPAARPQQPPARARPADGRVPPRPHPQAVGP